MSNISLLQLPSDVLVHIIKKLELSDLRNVMRTCKTLKNFILNDNSIWRSICKDMLILHNSSDNSQSISLSWYNQCRISHNWCSGIYKSKIVIHHYTNYMPWLKFHNSQGLVLSVGSELRCYAVDKRSMPNGKELLWKCEVPKVKRNDVRTNDISRFIIKDNFIACGNRDGCVAVYKLDSTIKERPRLLHHIQDCHEDGQVEVTAIELISKQDMQYVLTASNNNANIQFWYCKSEGNNGNGSLTHNGYHTVESMRDVKLSDTVGVRCLSVNCMQDKLAIGLNGNSKPLLLDVTMGELLMTANTTKNIKHAIRDIQWHNENTITYVTHSGKLQFIDIRTSEVIYDTMDPFQSTLYCVKTDCDRAILVGSAEYSRSVLFDIRNSKRHVQMYFTQKKCSPIYSLDFDSTMLIAAADRSVAVLNFNINSATAQLRDYSHAFEFVNR